MTVDIERRSDGAAPAMPTPRSFRLFCCFFDGLFDGRLSPAP